MKLLFKLFLLLSVAMPLVGGADPAAAQASRQRAAANSATPHVDGFDVESVKQLTPGTELDFTLHGTPGATATVGIDGARRPLALQETQLGLYEGTYTISSRDRITHDSRVTANVRLGNRVATAVLDDPLVIGAPRRVASAPAGNGPRVDSFEVQPVAALSGGNELNFTARGTPGGQASVQLPGARRFLLQETRPGFYTGSYTIRNGDRIDANAPVTLRLTAGDVATTSTLDRSLVADSSAIRPVNTPATRPAARPVMLPAVQAAAPRPCTNCATVVAVNPIEVKGPGSYVGPVAGGVVGALIGSQFGGGHGRTAAGVAGAVGGALAGREIERHVNKETHYEVVARLQSGGQQTFSYNSNPGLSVGTRVRVVDGRLVRE